MVITLDRIKEEANTVECHSPDILLLATLIVRLCDYVEHLEEQHQVCGGCKKERNYEPEAAVPTRV